LEFVKDNLNLPWSWFSLSHDEKLNWKIIAENINLSWYWPLFYGDNEFENRRYYKLGDDYIEKSEYRKLVQPILEHMVPIEMAEHIVSFI
jgi:hypothetical protein